MLELVREEVRGCTDVPRLHAAAGVLCQLAGGTEPVRSGALRSALILLANRYPKVGVCRCWAWHERRRLMHALLRPVSICSTLHVTRGPILFPAAPSFPNRCAATPRSSCTPCY